jgi:acetylornithine/N-succinyldiaminopimelate aminotransferase
MSNHAEALKKDPRVLEAKRLLLEAVKDHSGKIVAERAQDPTCVIQAHQQILDFAAIRGAPLFYPYLGSGIGRGSLVELIDGSVKYDMITGIGVHFLGHSHPLFTEAAFDAALEDCIMQGNLQQNANSLTLAKMLSDLAGLPHCFFSTSGVMANENAVKVAFQKNAPAARILAFDRCFAGRSLTFSQVTDKPTFREGLPLNVPVDYIPFFDPEKPDASCKAAEAALKHAISRYPKQHAIMMFELVQGEAGFYAAPKEFFEPLMKLCKEAHIAVFADEVQSFGRTTSPFSFQRLGLGAYVDIAAVGKLTQVCATLFTEEYKPKPGLLSQTFTGSTAAIHACIAFLKLIAASNIYGPNGRIQQIEDRFHGRLRAIQQHNPALLKGPFGIGAMIAFTPLDGNHDTAIQVAKALFEAGVLSFIAGSGPARIRFLVPALVITDEEIDRVMEIVEATLIKVKADVPH